MASARSPRPQDSRSACGAPPPRRKNRGSLRCRDGARRLCLQPRGGLSIALEAGLHDPRLPACWSGTPVRPVCACTTSGTTSPPVCWLPAWTCVPSQAGWATATLPQPSMSTLISCTTLTRKPPPFSPGFWTRVQTRQGPCSRRLSWESGNVVGVSEPHSADKQRTYRRAEGVSGKSYSTTEPTGTLHLPTRVHRRNARAKEPALTPKDRHEAPRLCPTSLSREATPVLPSLT